jgi:hypothetical protein
MKAKVLQNTRLRLQGGDANTMMSCLGTSLTLSLRTIPSQALVIANSRTAFRSNTATAPAQCALFRMTPSNASQTGALIRAILGWQSNGGFGEEGARLVGRAGEWPYLWQKSR